MALQGCVLEDMSDCAQYELTVNVVSPDGDALPDNVLETVGLYLFNQEGFVRMLSMSQERKAVFGYVKNEPLTLVAWGNLKQDSLVIPSLSKGQSLESALVRLRKLNSFDLTSTDLFYSFHRIADSADVSNVNISASSASTRSAIDERTLTLSLSRMVASMNIVGKNMDVRFGTDTVGYHFVVCSTNDAINFLAAPSGDTASYAPGTVMNTDGYLVTPVFRVLPTPSDGILTICLYRGDMLLYSTSTDSNEEALQAIAGKQLSITLDFRYSTVLVNVLVTPWDEGTQNTEF